MDSAPYPSPVSPVSETELLPNLRVAGRDPAATEAGVEALIPSFRELYTLAECHQVDLSEAEFARILLSVGERFNFHASPASPATEPQREAFFRSLHLPELALAQACALGRDAAWRVFLVRYREPLAQAATAITGSATLGRDLAEQLPSELFGLSAREGGRRSPLASYSGRGSLMGWLRSTLAQRHIDRHRRTHRESPLGEADVPAPEPAATAPSPGTVTHLHAALTAVLRTLAPDDAFLLSAWFLDGRTLLHIARLLHVSEATVSRKAKRLTGNLRSLLLARLQAGGLSRRAAEEALGTDPRDLSLNLRAVLQNRAASAFPQQARSTEASSVIE